MDDVYCDWCFRANQTNNAEFVAVIANLEDMRVTDWLICAFHANILSNKHATYSLKVGDILIDEYAFEMINDHAKKYYRIRP